MDAILRSASKTSRLELRDARVHRDDYFTCNAVITIDGDEWEPVELEMFPVFRSDMLAFFEDIAEAARLTFPTSIAWQSEFSQLHMTARGDGDGMCRLELAVRPKPRYEQTHAGAFSVRQEALRQFYERLRKVMGLPEGHRLRGYRRSD